MPSAEQVTQPTCTEKTSRAAGVVYDDDGLVMYGFVVDVVSVLARRVPTAACNRRRLSSAARTRCAGLSSADPTA